MKNKLLEASGEESNMDVTSESGSNTDVLTDTDDDNVEGTLSAKRRKLKPSERDLQMPLERGWKRETVIRGLGKTGVIKGDVSYYSPCGKTFRSSPDLAKVRWSVCVCVRARVCVYCNVSRDKPSTGRTARVIKLAIRASSSWKFNVARSPLRFILRQQLSSRARHVAFVSM